MLGTGLAVARQLEADAVSAAMLWLDGEECQALRFQTRKAEGSCNEPRLTVPMTDVGKPLM